MLEVEGFFFLGGARGKDGGGPMRVVVGETRVVTLPLLGPTPAIETGLLLDTMSGIGGGRTSLTLDL